MSLPTILLLFLVAIVGGTLNSVAGGGSFFTFPALIFANVQSVVANATSTVALWPGSVASAGAYRNELKMIDRRLLIVLVVTSLIGGVLGAFLLLMTPPSIFTTLIPYLLLIATLLFTFSGPVTKRLRLRRVEKTTLSVSQLVGMSFAQLVIAVYGGYFGGGIGILMLATLALMGLENIHVMNGLKTVLASCINGVAVITFIVAGAIYWPAAIVMVVGAIIGGYGGAYFARKIDQRLIRYFVIVVGFVMTLYFFIKTH
ncbi:sulfite exporter TauE/SafE family protein [Dictyobacter aurantiacus]|uniref:Probable membrane transporter protein n=1 Tax=Dictyobacter aurantiacus TaxID=1936993 RepID=A0A401ZD26_9CHLR|nr:sulfite exporter TauE/SafE family protein [Dictyobacter aurantiacus]GCE04736.1 UPF0721 transmembrane protein [Dictyobacter aurantiacus]